MHTLRSRIILITVATLLLVSGEGYRRNLALAQCGTPCFSTVGDVLQGRRTLLPVDDLVVTSFLPDSNGNGPANNLVLQTTNSSLGTQFPYPILSNANTVATGVGRMFNLPRDVIFTITGPPGGINVRDQDPNGPVTKGFPFPRIPQAITMADFTGDGFADVAVLAADSPGSTSGVLQIITANDVKNINAGLFVSNGVVPSFNFTLNVSITAGDFDADGKQEVVIAQPSGQNNTNNQINLVVYEVVTNQDGTLANPALQQVAAYTLPLQPGQNEGVSQAWLTAGDYDGAINANTGLPDDELVVAYRYDLTLVMTSFDVVPSSTNPSALVIAPKATQDVAELPDGDIFAGLVSGRLDWFRSTEQVVFALNDAGAGLAAVFTFDDQLNFQAGNGNNYGRQILSLALGNYDQSLGENDPPNLQVALLMADASSGSYHLVINQAGVGNNFSFSQVSDTQILSGVTLSSSNTLFLAAGDFQGRSLLLRPPSIVRLSQHYQPEVVLDAPPMHVDWITPDGETAPTVFNVTVAPSNYHSQYQTSETQNDQSSQKSTVSYSYTTKESLSDKISFGIPNIASLDVKSTIAAQQAYNNVVSNAYNTYQGASFNASIKTGFDDHLWVTNKRFNVYLYPVIGKCTPCADASRCTQPVDSCPAGTGPLVLQFSAPDMLVQEEVDTANVEWYQPVHEVGNVLSYPWNATQLQALFPGFTSLGLSSEVFFTDSSQTVEQANWTQGGGSNVTSGSTNTYSSDTSVSASASVNAVGDLFSLGDNASASFSWSSSDAFGTLNSNVQNVGSSTGFGIETPGIGVFKDPSTYQYAWQPFLFGQSSPSGTIQNITPTDADGNDVKVQAQGILRAAFTADPTNLQAGRQWWRAAYNTPDVALNHPNRWTLGSQTSAPNQNPPPNCLRVASNSPTMDCLSFNQADRTNPADSQFYYIKGLFITAAEAHGTGPQVTFATVGDQLLLQARVYNYSLVNMPAGTLVRVQFYGQEWDNNASQFTGPSFFIGEDTLAPIPGFNLPNTNGEIPNWALASTTFDTTNYSDTYLVFWVVVWMENGGSLVAEVPGHGLTAIPLPILTSIAEVPIEQYSNNVGYYPQPVYVAPKPSTQGVPAATENGEVTIENVQVSPTQVAPDSKVEVRVTFRAGTQAADNLSVFFYDGDPEAGGKAFDIDRVPYVRAQDIYTDRVLFQPRTCGTHTIFIVPRPGAATATAAATVEVDCPPPSPPATTVIGKADGVGRGTNKAQVRLTGKTTGTPALSLGSATLRLEALLNEVGGVGELIKKNGSGTPLLPLSLQALAGSDTKGASFETPAGVQPRVRAQIDQRRGKNLLRFSLKVDQASIPVPPARCAGTSSPTTKLTTRFTLTDGVHPTVVVSAEQPWECGKTELKTP